VKKRRLACPSAFDTVPRIRFYFDFISPFAYLAWKQAPALAARLGRELMPEPVLFAALLGHYGHLGPAEIPPKRAYILKQVLRRAHDLGLRVTPPPAHPFNPLLALRVASLDLEATARIRAIDALFAATWAGGRGVADADAITDVLDQTGLDGQALVAAASAPAAKDALRRQTDAAIAAGVFGVPTLIVDGELFWGSDALGDLERFVRGEDPLDHAALDRWSALPAAAQRRR
jgi:2-hydroxychromene-2-carboxylate isomerase